VGFIILREGVRIPLSLFKYFVRNRYLFNIYRKSILKKKNLIFFCESNSFNSAVLRSLRKELKKNNFLIKNVKTRLAKICLKNIFLKNLMHGPLFIIYNNSFTEKNMKYLQTFNKYNFILGIMFFNKFYLTSKIKQFKNFNSAFQFFISILETIYIFLFYNFNFLNKIYLK